MSDHSDEGLEELRRIRHKIDETGGEIKREIEVDPSPTISDDTASKFDEFMDELEEDLRAAARRFKGFCGDASDEACRFYESLAEDITDLRNEVKSKRHEITGGVGEKAAVTAIDNFHDRVDQMVQEQKRFPF
jgi:hypothetical protein